MTAKMNVTICTATVQKSKYSWQTIFCFIKDDGGKNATSWQTQKKGSNCHNQLSLLTQKKLDDRNIKHNLVISKAEVKSDLCYPIYEDNRSKN